MKKNNFWEDEDEESSEEYDDCSDEEQQRHVHEFLGSTKLAEEGDDRHNHRFAGVTGKAKRYNGSHIHEIRENTDFVDHFHQIIFRTGPAIIRFIPHRGGGFGNFFLGTGLGGAQGIRHHSNQAKNDNSLHVQ